MRWTYPNEPKRRLAIIALGAVFACAVGLQAANLPAVSALWSTTGLFPHVEPALAAAAANPSASSSGAAGRREIINAMGQAKSMTDAPLPNGPAPVFWQQRDGVYRGVHYLAKWDGEAQTWRRVSPDLTQAFQPHEDGYGIDGITSVASADGAMYVGTLAGQVSVQSAGKWYDCSQGLPERTVSALAICPGVNDGAVAAVGFAGYGAATPDQPGHLYVTFDGGNHWRDVTGNLPDAPVQSLQFLDNSGSSQLLVQVNGHWYCMSTQPGDWQPWPGR